MTIISCGCSIETFEQRLMHYRCTTLYRSRFISVQKRNPATV